MNSLGATIKITAAEVAQHKTKNDCWIIVREKVYDISTYLSKHPGGKESILRYAGGDATEIFYKLEHSATAQDILFAFCIGYIEKELDV